MSRELTEHETQVALWTARNRGKLTEIAAKARKSPQFVQMILRGVRKSEDGRIERLLREAGAPVKG